MRCGACGHRNPVKARFCNECGCVLPGGDPGLSPRFESPQSYTPPHLADRIRAMHRYEGTVNQVMGDGIMALFGAPLAQEDHAVRACYALSACRTRCADTPLRRQGVRALRLVRY